ncbi:MAG TPA: GNAT family N-acetyltransferase [Candidatus Acidoferrales bacterium]|nr:GNAT family N-acetyltransferase [Candidatus Acidoferrales bacterium]
MAAISVRVITRPAERDQAFAIRRRVFQAEQGVPVEEEFDADDAGAVHVLATIGAAAVGTGRIVFHPDSAKIGRMAVLKEYRRCGVGSALLAELSRVAAGRGVTRLILHAQVHAIPFYAALGFRVTSGEFMEAGIPHRRMEGGVV